MRGPRDSLIESTTKKTERGVSTEGGKALQRLLLFEQERGFPEEPIGEIPLRRRRRATRAATRARGAAPAELTDQEIAATYAEAAQALQAEQPMEATARALEEGGAERAALPPAWRWLGPTYMPNGQTYGDTRVDVSGRVSSIAIDPNNRNHILCGSAAGGVWESRDGGASWAPRTDNMPTLTVGAVAFNPSDPSIAYCGTGEGNWYRRFGAGVLRSVNGGTTWTVHAQAPFVGQAFFDLIVDPANGNHLLAATTGGAYESADGGVTWAQRRNVVTWDLAMHPAGGANAEVFAAGSNGLARSTNGGTTWAAVALPSAPANWDRLAVDICRSNPQVVYVFGASGSAAFLYRRQQQPNGTLAWVALPLPAGLSTGQAWYDWFVAAAPDSDRRVYLGAIEAYRGELGAAWTWTTISNKAGDDIHPDQHAIAFDPLDPNIVYVGNDGGLYRSPNRGTNWVALNRGLGITEIEYLAQDYGSSHWLIGGTQDNGSIRYRGSAVWDHVQDGDGGDCGVNRGSPNIVFHTFYGMGMERSTIKGDWGSWGWIGPNVPANYSALFYPPMEANNSTIAQAGQTVYVSRNNGTNWTDVNLAAGVVASAMYIPTIDRVLVGTTNGRLFRVNWTGAAWGAATELTRPRNAWMSDIFCEPNNTNRIWVTYSQLGGGRVYRSDDGGTTWQDRTSNLPNLPINAIEVDPWNANRVWVAADVGVYQSFDGGATWAPFSLGLPNVLVYDLVFHPHARVLRAGTRNRGTWEIPVDGWLANPICGVQWVGNLAGNASARWFTFNWPATWHVIWTVMPTNPRPGSPQVMWNVQVERASAEYVTYWITVTNLTPDPLTFEGRYAILSRY
jgi:hypothetical protein